MEPPDRSPDWLDVFTAAERPDLWQRAREERTFEDVWPVYNNHGNNTGRYFSSLFPKHAHLQILLVDRRSERLIARGRTIPVEWDGSMENLPAGIDEAGLHAIEESCRPSALAALAAEVDPDYQGTGLSSLVIASMRSVAQQARLTPLIAPVRPNWKDRYPLIAIERYATWVRDDGLPFDPWMRVHARLGGRILRAAPRSLEITAPVDDWRTWTGMEFPEDGTYVFPAGLAPLDVQDGVGRYWEPNVWMVHDIGA
ncbi:MAG: hypothetical protein WAM97_13930 [Acidimicrobiales bacterium]